MSEWTSDELESIAAAEELQLASARRGRTSTWFRGAQDWHEDSYVPPMISPQARATTIQLVPRSTG
jgi:hypothetical protein